MSERPAKRIMQGLSEAAAWAAGDGKAWVTFPDGKRLYVTREEYEKRRAALAPTRGE